MKAALDLLRHGETTGGSGFRGRLDDPLSETGWRQMREAVRAAPRWQRILSSPLRRCADFAAVCAEAWGVPLRLDPRLMELDFGAWEGRTAAELMETDAEALGRFWRDPYAFTPPQGETMVDFERRVTAAIEDARAGEGDVLVVTHAGVMRLLLARAQGLPRARLLEVEVRHAALIRLAVARTSEPGRERAL
ncbi:alpha-ribazole phosphatase family protein [Stutzerimonas urumqiensis]|uniref:alpha-ribazole phosphatase family protein n=1 Tax=Stutzerimonas urumqiensis TaxID=638269 RepID=UPI003DA32803